MVVNSDTVEKGQKEIKTDWPSEEGLDLGTSKIEGRQINLVAKVNRIRPEEMKGL